MPDALACLMARLLRGDLDTTQLLALGFGASQSGKCFSVQHGALKLRELPHHLKLPPNPDSLRFRGIIDIERRRSRKGSVANYPKRASANTPHTTKSYL
jgi:hypothetical protein